MPFAPTHGGREGLWGGVESMGVVAVLPGLVRGSRGGTRAGLGFGPSPVRRPGGDEASACDADAMARSRVAESRFGATNVRPKATTRGAGSRRAGEGSRERARARTPRSVSSRLDVVAAGARNRNASASRSRASACAPRATARPLDALAARDIFRRCIGVVELSSAFPGASAFPRSRRRIPGDDVVREIEIRSAPLRASRHSRRRHRVLDAPHRRVAPVRSNSRACQPPRAPRMCRAASRHRVRAMLAPSVGPRQENSRRRSGQSNGHHSRAVCFSHTQLSPPRLSPRRARSPRHESAWSSQTRALRPRSRRFHLRALVRVESSSLTVSPSSPASAGAAEL